MSGRWTGYSMVWVLGMATSMLLFGRECRVREAGLMRELYTKVSEHWELARIQETHPQFQYRLAEPAAVNASFR